MEQNKHFELKYPKLQAEALLKSLLCGLTVGFGVDVVLGFIWWMTGIQKLGLVIISLIASLIVVTAATAAILYAKKFRPTVITNARRIDKLGLEERVITMIEYQNDDSFIANIQRRDAVESLERVDSSQLKLQIGRKIFITLIIFSVIGLAMSTVASLSAADIFPGLLDVIDTLTPEDPPVYIPVSYIAEDGGYIDGEMEQLILMGENAEPVVAVPEEGYSFEGWDDGYKKPSRTDKEIDHPLVLTAIFLPLEEDGEDGGEESGENGEEPGEEEGDGQQKGDSEQPSDQESDQKGEGQGKYNKVNQIIDGNKYYREFLEEYKDKIMELLDKKVEDLTEEEKAIIEAYINIV